MTIGMFGVLVLAAAFLIRHCYQKRVSRDVLEARRERELLAQKLRARARERRRIARAKQGEPPC